MKKHERDKFEVAHIIRRQLRMLEQAKLLELASQGGSLSNLVEQLQNIRHQVRRCAHRGYLAPANRIRERGIQTLVELHRETEHILGQYDYSSSPIPTVRNIVNDLMQLEDEFPAWRYEGTQRTLIVSTDPIELKGIYLGPFDISLQLDELSNHSQREMFIVTALDPHPAAGNDHVTHPHVSDEKLCTGDAGPSIRTALEGGRIADFFILVRSILTTYNPDSPYVKLEEWAGEECGECGYRMHEDSTYFCERCEQNYCDECIGWCRGCDLSLCQSCLDLCPECEESICTHCVTPCGNCESRCCQSCLTEDLCPTCIQEQEHQDEDEKSQETEDQEEAIPTGAEAS